MTNKFIQLPIPTGVLRLDVSVSKIDRIAPHPKGCILIFADGQRELVLKPASEVDKLITEARE